MQVLPDWCGWLLLPVVAFEIFNRIRSAHMKLGIYHFVLFSLLFARWGGVQAQTTPTPGDIERQMQVERTLSLPALPALQSKPQRIVRPSQPAAGLDVTRVSTWRVEGHTVLTSTVLDSVLQAFTGVDLSLRQLQEAAYAVQQAYEDRGWVARVVLPPQDITEGTVRIQIVEARMGEVLIDPGSQSLVDMDRVKRRVMAAQTRGGLLHANRLDRGLLLADDLDGVSVVGILQPGSREDSSDVLLKTTAEKPWTFDAALDNTNARAVGDWRATGFLTLVSPWGLGESFNLQGLQSEGSALGRVAVNLPLGDDGWRASANASQMDYKVVTPDTQGQKQNIRGQVSTLGLGVYYPLLRSREVNLMVHAGAEQRSYNSHAAGALNADYRVHARTVAVNGNAFDSLGDGGVSSLSMTWTEGEVQNGAVAVNPDVLGRYNKLGWSLSRQQAWGNNLAVYVLLQGQRSGKAVLDTSENFMLGGVYGVRAYPSGEATGPHGHLASLELRWRISGEWLVTPFYDWGQVSGRSNSQGGPAAYSLSGPGVSATWSGSEGWQAKATYAHRHGNNPNPTSTGADQDGALRKDRLWLSLNRSF